MHDPPREFRSCSAPQATSRQRKCLKGRRNDFLKQTNFATSRSSILSISASTLISSTAAFTLLARPSPYAGLFTLFSRLRSLNSFSYQCLATGSLGSVTSSLKSIFLSTIYIFNFVFLSPSFFFRPVSDGTDSTEQRCRFLQYSDIVVVYFSSIFCIKYF